MAISDTTNQHSDGSARSDAAQKRARDAAAIVRTEDSGPDKKHKVALNEIAAEYVCPLTRELPVDPVMAKDGQIYERSEILKWLARNATSPVTREPMGTELTPVPLIRNTIEKLVSSGAIDGEISAAWTKKLADEEEVKEMRARAAGGDEMAPWQLGMWYQFGKKGLAKDDVQARAWYERSAAAGDPRGLALFGQYLLYGWGGPQDSALGLVNVTKAAQHDGSDVAAYILGNTFFHGYHGLPKDPVRARPWLEKVVRGRFYLINLSDAGRARAAEMLRELDEED